MTPDAPSKRITLTAVGDIMLDSRLLPPRTFFHYPDVTTCGGWFEGQVRYPFVNTSESARWLNALDRHVHGVHYTAHMASSIPLELPQDGDRFDYPFRGVADEFRASDLVFANLECPLSTRGRRMQNDAAYSADPAFAAAMAAIGVRVVSFANNHCFDYGEVAFRDTLDTLKANGIAVAGAGTTLQEARTPAIIEIDGLKIAFLAYSMIGPDWIYATDTECGVAPLNPMIVGQDIARVRGDADLVALSVHWGVEVRPMPWPRLVELAHDFIDTGADMILGHHPHVPGSIEIYRDRPIFYSLGNFIFGHDHGNWGDNMLVKLHIDERQLSRIEILPIRGRYQPAVVNGEVAAAFHRQLVEVSRPFGTNLTVSERGSTIDLAS
jgi:poly-gamma-glutamate synthesis protein (capsule biosynthesis protein)